MEEAIKEEVKNFTLPDRKVLVVPVKRKGGWLPPGHEAEHLFKSSYYDLPLPKRGGVYKEVLTPAEKKFFESNGEDLNENLEGYLYLLETSLCRIAGHQENLIREERLYHLLPGGSYEVSEMSWSDKDDDNLSEELSSV